ncbi:general substrate transporter [Thozetella sp. PMI_491]|nr:general substrate transporter [Thozetella sp. PMI_491]
MGFVASLRRYPKAVGWSAFLSLAIIMEGFDTALLSNLYANPPFMKKFGELQPDGSYELTAAWQAALSNAAMAGEIAGLFLNGIIAERIGYRYTMIGALSLITIFIFIIYTSQTLTQLLIGEILAGVPWGVFQTLTTTYASEVCPVHLRAYLTTYVNLCWVLGQLLASSVLRAMLSRTDEWSFRIPFALQWVWPGPLILGVYFAPESPWWLVRKGKIEEARQALERLTTVSRRSTFNVSETISMMVHTNEVERASSSGTGYRDLFRGAVNRRRTEIVCVVWAIQLLCGATFMGYSTYFYRQAGLDLNSSYTLTVAQYALGAVGTVLSWFMMQWAGRRTIYLDGQIILCGILIAIGLTSLAGRENVTAQWIIGSLLIAFTFIYDCSVGPVCYSLVAELSSTRLRTKAVVLARNVYNLCGVGTSIMTPLMLNPSAWNWGAKSAFFWVGTSLACIIWTYYRLPEPKGKTYGEMEILFERGVPARRFRDALADHTGHEADGEDSLEKDAFLADSDAEDDSEGSQTG